MIRTFELDADDKATILMALLHRLGHPYRVVLLGGGSVNVFSSLTVKIQTCDGGAWMDVEW